MVPKPFVVVEAGVEAKEVAGEMAEEVAGVVTTIEVEGVVEDGAILFDCTTPSKKVKCFTVILSFFAFYLEIKSSYLNTNNKTTTT